MRFLILVNKTEKKIIKEKFPNAHIVRTMKQKSKRHHYYCEETPRIVRLISNMRHTPET
nr:MAG TPA: hypothetical protein [Caudoviricetes sp.]